MSVRITEKSATYRLQEGTVEESVETLKAQGWQVYAEGDKGAALTHPDLPGHTRIVEAVERQDVTGQ